MSATTWTTVPLGEVIELHDHRRVPLNSRERQQRQGPFPYYGAQGIIDSVDGFLFDGEFILVAEDGENLNSRKLPLALKAAGRFWVNNHAHVLRGKPDVIDDDFLLAALNGVDVRPYVTGAAQPKLSQANLRLVEVPLPPLAVQQRIAGILSAYDHLIKNCEQRIRALDDMARTHYREWLVASASHARRVLAQDLVDRGVLEINDGYRAKNSELGGSGLPFARAGNINGGFLFDDADVLAEANVARAGSKVSRPDDILFTSKGTVGRFAMVRRRTPRFVYSPQLCYWRVLDSSELSPNYLFRWMQSREFLDQVDGVKGSTDMADYVSLTNQRRMSVRVPSREDQARATGVLRAIDETTGTLTDQRDNLRRARDLLLPRLLSGELNVEDAA